MATDYLLEHAAGKKKRATKATPQTKRIEKAQAKNAAGGFVWKLNEFDQFKRFLILGSEGGTYYTSEKKLTKDNAKNIIKCLKMDGLKTVQMIVDVSKGGRAAKNDPALFALAVAISEGDATTKRAAGFALPEVARIGTHLYHFIAYVETMRGWGVVLEKAVKNWYDSKPTEKLAYDAIKYRQRDGWSHRDVLRKSHAHGGDNAVVYDWITHGVALKKNGAPKKLAYNKLPNIIQGFEEVQSSNCESSDAARLVREFNLPREALQTQHLNDPEVWRALLDVGMPMTALIRNLATMTRNGVFKSNAYKNLVVNQIQNQELLTKARVHPMNVLTAMKTYAGGCAYRASMLYGGLYSTPDRSKTWNPVASITDALDEAFYMCFGNVNPSGKNLLLGVDISGSMASTFSASPLQCIEAAAAMALVALHTEPNVTVGGFNTGFAIRNVSKKQRLDDAVRTIVGDWGYGTDCAKPFQWALKNDLSIDGFVSFTDNETWAGSQHPKQALDQYRQKSGLPARTVVVGMTSTGFTIADPNDSGMLDVVGFDTATPSLISDFLGGNV